MARARSSGSTPKRPSAPRSRPRAKGEPRPRRPRPAASNASSPSSSRPQATAHSREKRRPFPSPSANGSAGSPTWFADLLQIAQRRGAVRVEALRARYPTETRRQLGERLVQSNAFRAGLFGAATGTLALIALPIGLPAGIAVTLLLEAELLFALLALYDLSAEGTAGRFRLYALWAGAGFADAAKSAGLRLGADAIGRALAGSLPARIIARLNPVLLRAILRRLGLGWLPRALKMWPLLGAPVGFALDRSALRALGSAALDTLESRPQ